MIEIILSGIIGFVYANVSKYEPNESKWWIWLIVLAAAAGGLNAL